MSKMNPMQAARLDRYCYALSAKADGQRCIAYHTARLKWIKRYADRSTKKKGDA